MLLSLGTSIFFFHSRERQRDISIRNMHHQAVKSNLADLATERKRVGIGSAKYDQPLCPKPVRLSPAVPEFLKPISQPNVDEGSGVLNMITEKNADKRELACNGCLPSCYSGSPPRRTENPLVHDVEFLHQVEVVSPLARTKLSDKFGFTSASPM
ncbi:uncharacterized protein LOC130714389 isoform X2 [Lotus japonicus]|uniref:uncharacterized protein LOC130714389 isoform X2 n=1 Tax=Lotus japonicus TaxID=34305 RepID=UPI00258D200D|nr:uncharacterized protein LOC130714389 isoform X2 [Lotus japonicus]